MMPGPRVIHLFSSLARHDYQVLASVHLGACFTHLLHRYRNREHGQEVEDGKYNKDVNG
jgi:hypothetical protein